jgi:hypothetical protein
VTWNRLSSGSYFPPPVKAVEVPKPHGGGVRVLGVPTVTDRVAQTVVAMELEKVVERKFHPSSYGYRPGRSPLDAVTVCRERCFMRPWVYRQAAPRSAERCDAASAASHDPPQVTSRSTADTAPASAPADPPPPASPAATARPAPASPPADEPHTAPPTPDRKPLPVAVPPDLLELFHPGHHPHWLLPLEFDEPRTVGRRSDGGGATSSHHTGATSNHHPDPRQTHRRKCLILYARVHATRSIRLRRYRDVLGACSHHTLGRISFI